MTDNDVQDIRNALAKKKQAAAINAHANAASSAQPAADSKPDAVAAVEDALKKKQAMSKNERLGL